MLGCPAYFFGMYSNKVNALAINLGIIFGTLVFFILFVQKAELPDFYATIVNIGIVIFVTWCPGLNAALNNAYYGSILKFGGDQSDPYDPALFPNFLTFDTVLPRDAVGYDIRKGGGPKFEPIRPWWINFIVFMLLFLAIPFWINLPSSYDETSFSGAMPTWAVASTFFAAIAMLMNIFQTYYNWEDWITREGKQNQHKIVKYAVDDGTTATASAPKADL